MRQIIKIAWRNVWRNKLRSLVVITSIVLGLWAGMFSVAMILGLNEQRMDSAINSYLSHIQIHHPSFTENFDIEYTITQEDELLKNIAKNKEIIASSSRTKITGMASTAHGSTGVLVIGINPDQEKSVTVVDKSLIKGTYFTKVKSKPAIIGEELAEKLKLDIGKKIYITFVDTSGNQQRMKLKVEGIFKTASTLFDGANLFMKKEDLNAIIGNESAVHEIAIMCHSIEQANGIKNKLNESFPNNKAETWAEIAPEFGYAQQIMSSVIYIFMGIILIALSFGIINTMLMAVIERKKELGMLMSVGLNKKNVFSMIIFETLFITLVAAPLGISLSYFMISYFGTNGINLSVVGEGLENFGIGTRVYTALPTRHYVNISILTLFVTFVSSLFPARRALKLDPAEAVRAL